MYLKREVHYEEHFIGKEVHCYLGQGTYDIAHSAQTHQEIGHSTWIFLIFHLFPEVTVKLHGSTSKECP